MIFLKSGFLFLRCPIQSHLTNLKDVNRHLNNLATSYRWGIHAIFWFYSLSTKNGDFKPFYRITIGQFLFKFVISKYLREFFHVNTTNLFSVVWISILIYMVVFTWHNYKWQIIIVKNVSVIHVTYKHDVLLQ